MPLGKWPEQIGKYPRRKLSLDEMLAEQDKAKSKPLEPAEPPKRRDAALPRPTEGGGAGGTEG